MISIEETQGSVQSHRQIAAGILGPIKWADEHKGYCACPGEYEHSSKTGKSDCVVYLDGAANISCFHASCIQARHKASINLRQALAGAGGGSPQKLSKAELKERRQEELKRGLIETRAASSLRLILKRYTWTAAGMQNDSPVPLEKLEPGEHWKQIVHLFNPNDVIWMGGTYDSGKAEHQAHFRCAHDWLKENAVKGQFTCPATFKNNSFSRCNDDVLARRFLVVESDVLNRDQVGAVFRWINQEVGLPLRAVVDTAGKSLHGWFDFPKKQTFDELQIVLPHLGCDPGLFRASQPCRMPGALRDGKFQKLIYLNEKEGK